MGTVVEYPTPRSRASGGGGPLSAQWTDASRVALVGPGDLPVRVGIDTYTWAELQTAYPNNGAALLALAANTMVFVSEPTWRALMVRSPDGAYWVSVHGSIALHVDPVAVAGHTGTLTKTIQKSILIPGGLATPNSMLRIHTKHSRLQGSGAALASSQGSMEISLNTSAALGGTVLGWTRFSSTNRAGEWDTIVQLRNARNSQISSVDIETPGATQVAGAFRTAAIDMANDAYVVIAFELTDTGHIHTLQSTTIELICR